MGMISTRGRYALRVMIDLAEQTKDTDRFIPMKEVASRQGVSLKYLEQILPVLTKNKLVQTSHGKGGGYRLVRKPEEYTVGDILRLTENDLAPVSCLSEGAEPCEKADKCHTLSFWKGLNDTINDYLDGTTIKDLM